MSSAFNLSTLVAMQEQRVEQVSVHFWRCQLTREQPRFEWHPDRPAESGKHSTAKNGDENAKDNKEADHDDNKEDEGATRHLLHVTGCVLSPKATGIHLVTVRTQGAADKQQQRQEEKEKEKEEKYSSGGTPIVCVDPATQRTLVLGHEFVLETGGDSGVQQQQQFANGTASSCIFELTEGDGPVWLTGTHRVHRVVPLMGGGEDEDEEEEAEEEEEEEEEGENEQSHEDEEEDIEEEEMEEDDEEEEDEEEEEEKPKKKAKKPATKAASKKPPSAAAIKRKQQQQQQQQQQQSANGQRRKRAKPDS